MEGERIACLILALESHNLLVPQSLVAEPGLDDTSTPPVEAPAWLTGVFEWQNRHLTVIDFERLCGTGEPSGRARRLVVLRAIGGYADIVFYALRVKGVPHPIRVAPDDLQALPDGVPEDCRKWVQGRVQVAGITCDIPDVDAIERLISGTESPITE